MVNSCSKFGIENPIPQVTKRLAWYGNAEDIEKAIERVVNKHRDEIKASGTKIDTVKFTSNEVEIQKDIPNETRIKDLQETIVPKSKRAGLIDMKLLAT